ncbi:hypothetical protein RNZ50_19495 [Paracoccaceae bacterium Fryx2]|nr:hypothetical protein [Paracoccaceae bacterium Fryx2]
MMNRQRLLMGATALLYSGPLLAGLGGYGWALVPVFTAIFMLWHLILRPQQWPQDAAGWMRPEAWLLLLGQGAMQVLLVAVCFGVGRGTGGVLGALPPFPVMLPIAISFLSIPLARLLWDPWKAAANDGLPEVALNPTNPAPPDPLADTAPLPPDAGSPEGFAAPAVQTTTPHHGDDSDVAPLSSPAAAATPAP